MPPYSAVTPATDRLILDRHGSFDSILLQQHECATIRMGDAKKPQLATPEWNTAHLISPNEASNSSPSKTTASHRLNIKTHVFKKELQEYVPTQIEDRLRIETIIYAELSIVNAEDGALVNNYDFLRVPKDLFFSQPDKIMSAEDMASKRILSVTAALQCPSNNWQEEKETCIRCARRMSSKLEQAESRIMHLLPELHRAENGDALISFRAGVANIQFKVNCYCSHKKEKEGFVVRFDSQSDDSIASHVTMPLMFYHQNKNRIAARAAKALAKAQAKAEQQLKKQQQMQAREILKAANRKAKREARNGRNQRNPFPPSGYQHHMPSPPASVQSSPIEHSVSPEISDFMDKTQNVSAMSTGPPDPMTSLFPELSEESRLPASQQSQQQQQQPMAFISHMTPSTGPTRGGTLVTIHGSGFTVGEMMYVCFGETFVPIIPQRDHMLECFTPAWTKAETVPVFALHSTIQHNMPAQATFTYVDDNEKEMIKLALQRMMNISARMEGPLDSVLSRANEFAVWSDILDGTDSSIASSPIAADVHASFANLENMVLESIRLLDTAMSRNVEGLSIANSTGHTMLHLSVLLQYKALAKDLILRNVDVQLRDKNGLTALDTAYRLGAQAMVDILLPNGVTFKDVDAMSNVDDSSPGFQTDYTVKSMEPMKRADDLKASGSLAMPLRDTVFRDHPAVPSKIDSSATDFNWSEEHLVRLHASSGGTMSHKDILSAIPIEDDDSVLSTSTQGALWGTSGTKRLVGSVVLPPPSVVDVASSVVVAEGGPVATSGQKHRRLLLPEHNHSSIQEGVIDPVRVHDVRMAPVRVVDADGVVVAARRRSNDGVGAFRGPTEQAVVQSSRSDVESEPVLFLGGMPVSVALRGVERQTQSNPVVQQKTSDESKDEGVDRDERMEEA
ncbi:SPT3 Dosage dependent suppressor of Ty-induced promoter mutations-like protein [Mortierella sp. GBA30]|nr:SPT3 Dosage dependent suppressor of Ty-induced promoter mutations-like protein [Mortierella sp. GBA30]